MKKDYHKGVKLQLYIPEELSQELDNFIKDYFAIFYRTLGGSVLNSGCNNYENSKMRCNVIATKKNTLHLRCRMISIKENIFL